MSKIQNRSTKGDKPIQELPIACADEAKAVEFMEKHRWGDHPGCPRCGDMDVYQMKSRDGDREKFLVALPGLQEAVQRPYRHGIRGFTYTPAPLVHCLLASINQQKERIGP